MTDEELLNKYHHYIKKRRIVISLLLFFLIIIAAVIIYYFPKTSKDDSVIIEKEKDHTPPVIVLETTNISIYKNETIDYLSYVKSVQDDIEGDLKDKLQYNEIDTSNIGNFEIIYTVSDSSNNTGQSKLTVEIKEKKVESLPQEEQTNSSNTPSENQSSSPSSNNNNSNKSQKPSNNSTNKPTPKVIKYFLFEDGYTMANVAEACATELKKLGVAGMCSPIQDSAGIYLGMKLETN